MKLLGIAVSQRTRKIWLSVVASLAGTAAVSLAAVWIETARETDLADPTAGITDITRQFDAAAAPPLAFTDVAAEMGIVLPRDWGPRSRRLPEDTGSGLAWGDYDGDGDWDLYVVDCARPTSRGEKRNRLFRNDGDRFSDVTDTAGVGDPDGFGMGATFADYDDDGDVDLYVTNHGPNRLYRNRGDGAFDEVAAQAGVDDPLWSTGAAWGDFDRDGHLDLYVCNYVDYDPPADFEEAPASDFDRYHVPYTLNPSAFDPAPNRLFRNRGDGTFEEVAAAMFVDDPTGRSFAASFCDFDGDGWLDLYVTNDVSENKLFHNLGGHRRMREGGRFPGFVDIAPETGTADIRGSMGLSVGEAGFMNGQPDGLPDIFFTNWVAQEDAIYQSVRTPAGRLEYRDRARQFRLSELTLDTVGWGYALADLDLDGRTDLAIANGSTLESKSDSAQLTPEPLYLFWNDGRQFRNLAETSGEILTRPHNARGLAIADFDNDGDPDLAVSVNRGQPLLLRNDTPSTNRSLKVRLRGPAAACFGAKVELTAGGSSQILWYASDVTYLGMHAAELTFGLGRRAKANHIRVTWADGQETVLSNAPAGTIQVAHPESQR